MGHFNPDAHTEAERTYLVGITMSMPNVGVVQLTISDLACVIHATVSPGGLSSRRARIAPASGLRDAPQRAT
jgi:hypothetical protein